MRNTLYLEHAVYNYVIHGRVRKRMPKILKYLIDRILSEEVDALHRHICPYCNTKFRSKTALALHISKTLNITKCKYAFDNDVKYVIDEYLKLSNRVSKYGSHHHIRYGGKQYKFKTLDELISFIEQHPDILKQV